MYAHMNARKARACVLIFISFCIIIFLYKHKCGSRLFTVYNNSAKSEHWHVLLYMGYSLHVIYLFNLTMHLIKFIHLMYFCIMIMCLSDLKYNVYDIKYLIWVKLWIDNRPNVALCSFSDGMYIFILKSEYVWSLLIEETVPMLYYYI